MKEFNSHLEASLYLESFSDSLFEMEEQQLPLKRYMHFIHKNVCSRQFYQFPYQELKNTGIYTIAYTEGRKTGIIKTVNFMPYKISGNLFVARTTRVSTSEISDKIYLFSHDFFEQYRLKNKLDAGMDIMDVIVRFFGRSHHGITIYMREKKYTFSCEGVETAENQSLLYMTTTYDDSLKVNLNGIERMFAEKQINDYINQQ